MSSVLRMAGQGPRGLTSVRKIGLGFLMGLAGACLLIVWTERRAQQAETEKAQMEARARPYTGPAPVVMRSTVGGAWLTPMNNPQLPLRANLAQFNPLAGSGYSSARGGPGSAWGPLGEMANAPLPVGAWGGFNAPIARVPDRSVRLDYPHNPPLLVVTDAGYKVNTIVPHSLRYKDRHD